MEIETRIAGIPCKVKVVEVDGDYIDWIVLDRKGYSASWLADKLTMKDEWMITQQLAKEMSNVH